MPGSNTAGIQSCLTVCASKDAVILFQICKYHCVVKDWCSGPPGEGGEEQDSFSLFCYLCVWILSHCNMYGFWWAPRLWLWGGCFFSHLFWSLRDSFRGWEAIAWVTFGLSHCLCSLDWLYPSFRLILVGQNKKGSVRVNQDGTLCLCKLLGRNSEVWISDLCKSISRLAEPFKFCWTVVTLEGRT